MITGDGYRSQRPNSVHFGLGAVDRIEKAEIRWPDGQTASTHNIVVNASNEISVPRDKSVGR
jgi:hypothetical protein